MKPTVLYLLEEWPWPLDAGARTHDKLMLRCLCENWTTHVACWDSRPTPTSWPGCASFHVLEYDRRYARRKVLAAAMAMAFGRPIPKSQFLSQASREQLRSLVRRIQPDVIILSGVELGVLLPALKRCSRAKLVVDIHDVQTQRTQSIIDSLPATKWKERLVHMALLRSFATIEERCYRCADVIWAMKEEDRHLLQGLGGPYRIHLVPNVTDPDEQGRTDQLGAAREAPVRAAYVGNYAGEPNERCALELIAAFRRSVFPAVETRLFLVGVNPSASMRRAAAGEERIIITGSVPSLAEFLTPVNTIFVAPLFAGGGIKRKVIEAMMAGCPVVTTAVGAEGLELTSGATAIVVRPEEVAGEFIKLAGDRERRIAMAEAARRHVNHRFGFGRLSQAIGASFAAMHLD
jgi:polysaccharide biosynthesis protein PslH